jgi:hypothetical protein
MIEHPAGHSQVAVSQQEIMGVTREREDQNTKHM